MTRPNVFIIGAPKCGTTSLAKWLSEHPQVYFSPVKEPHYFNFDYGNRRVTELSRYERLFKNARDHHRVICEGSTSYLYSQIAVPAILEYVAHAKFIVMTRNPVDMAPSLHAQRVFNLDENEPDFAKAWQLQHVRRYGAKVPRHCKDPQILQYGAICRLGKQLERLYSLVPPERIHVIELELLRENPRSEYVRLMRFLRIDDDGRSEFPVENSAKARRAPWLLRIGRSSRMLLESAGIELDLLMSNEKLKRLLAKPQSREPLAPSMRRELQDWFREDQKLLRALIERNRTLANASPQTFSP